jgi:hypothetical protein
MTFIYAACRAGQYHRVLISLPGDFEHAATEFYVNVGVEQSLQPTGYHRSTSARTACQSFTYTPFINSQFDF